MASNGAAAAAALVFACASVQGAYTITSFSASGSANYNLSGEPGLGSDSASDGQFLPTGAGAPYPLSINASLSLPRTSNGTFYNAIVANNSELVSDGVEGILSQQYEYETSSSVSGNLSSTVRTQALFTVTGWSSWDLSAIFTDTGAGNFIEIKNEDTGAIVFQETAGMPVAASGVLSAGTYRFTARMLHNRSGSIGNSSDLKQRQMQFDLTLLQTPAPATPCLLGLAAMRRRRR